MTSIAVITERADVLERCHRWAAAVEARVEPVTDPEAGHRAWRRARAVVVDGDRLAWVRSLGLPRRDHVVILAESPAPQVWADALALGAVGVWRDGDDEPITGALTRALDGRGEACVLAVVGATGGVGASTLVVACAEVAQHRGAQALAVDADPAGPGLDLVAGLEHTQGPRWHEITLTEGHVAARALAEALPGSTAGARLLSFGRRERADVEPGPVLAAAQRGFDVVVGDVPRHALAPAGLGAQLLARSVAAVLIVPEHVTGLGAADRLLSVVSAAADRLLVVSRVVPGALGPRQVERALGLPVLARLRWRRALAQDVEHGRGPARSPMLRRVAGRVLDAVGVDAS